MVAKMGQRCSVAVAAVRMGPRGVITCNRSSLPSLSLCVQPPPMYSLVTIGRSLRWGRGTELGKRTSSIFQCRVPITRAASEECTNMSSIYFEIKGRIQTKYFPDLMNNKDFPLFFNAIILL